MSKKVELLTSSATSSLAVKKHQQSLKFLLEKKKVHYDEYDVASDAEKKEVARHASPTGQIILPTLLVDGKWVGEFEEIENLEEDGSLNAILGL